MTNKKGAFNVMVGIVLGIVTILMFLIFGYKFGDVVLPTLTENGSAYNATNSLMGSNGLGLVVSLITLVILIAVFAAIFAMMKFRQ